MNIYCPSCGAQNKSVGAVLKFCGQCGDPLTKKFETASVIKTPKAKIKRRVVIEEDDDDDEDEDEEDPPVETYKPRRGFNPFSAADVIVEQQVGINKVPLESLVANGFAPVQVDPSDLNPSPEQKRLRLENLKARATKLNSFDIQGNG